MSEHPINFSAPMVNAILHGKKTQERRVIVPQGKSSAFIVIHKGTIDAWPLAAEDEPSSENDWAHWPYRAPFGGCGSRLWVRESWQTWTEHNKTSAADLPSEVRANINYVANGNTWDARVRPPVSMPRWASRITLEIKDVRVERLQDISEEDAKAEGIYLCSCEGGGFKFGLGKQEYDTPIEAYRELWNSLHAKKGFDWEANK